MTPSGRADEMPDYSGRNAVVTGAASGIGRALALAFASRGMNVLASDVQIAPMQDLGRDARSHPGTITIAECDVSDYASVMALRDTARARLGPIHVLCNNAGVSLRRRGIYATHEDWTWLIGVNMWGIIHGVEAFLPDMLASSARCHIVNTASMHGVVPSPFSAVYAASKYAVVGLSETLRNELRGTDVHVAVLCPGPVQSNIRNSERNRPPNLASQTTVPDDIAAEPSIQFDLTNRIPPEDVAALVLAGLSAEQFYLFTDMLIAPLIDQRHGEMMAGFEFLREWQRKRRAST